MKLRDRLYVAQAGSCCYCDKPMFMRGHISAGRFGSLFGLTNAQAKLRVATLEHLKRRADGGTNQRDNLALACQACNSRRQGTNWVEYRSQRTRSPMLRAMNRRAYDALRKEVEQMETGK